MASVLSAFADLFEDKVEGVIETPKALVENFINNVTGGGSSGGDEISASYNESDYSQAVFLYETYKLDFPIFNLLFAIPDRVIIDMTSKMNDFVKIENNMFWKLLNYDSNVVKSTSDSYHAHSSYSLSNGHAKIFVITLMFATSYRSVRAFKITKKMILK